jgi:hypothetical protein
MSGQGKNGQDEQLTNGRTGYSGKSLLLLFVGGAVTGAAVAYLAQRGNRARVGALAAHAREMAAHLPQAVRDASHAAKEAFTEAYGGNGEAAPKRKHHTV